MYKTITRITGNGFKGMGIHSLQAASVANVLKDYKDTEMQKAFITNASAQAYDLPDDEMADSIIKSFFAGVSTYLGLVKVAKEDEAVALVLTDITGAFKFAAIIEYHENPDTDETGNWSYVFTLNEEDVDAIAEKKTLQKKLFSDDAFKSVFNKACYDVGSITFDQERYFYDAFLLIIDTIIGVLDHEAVDGEQVDIELPGYFTASVSIEGDEKIFAITPGGQMKALAYGAGDVEIDK